MPEILILRTNPLFKLGEIVATPAATKLMKILNINPSQLLERHVAGDYGDISEEDRKVNENAIKEGYEIHSSFKFNTQTIWLITASDRRLTCILLPSDY